jgi:hypothetical protein
MSDNHGSPSIGKRVGEFMILALYLTVDGVEIWHRSHFWALLLAFLGLLALMLLDGGFSKRQYISILGIALISCIALYSIAPVEIAPEAQVTFKLLPGDEPTPDTGCNPSEAPKDQPFQGLTMFGFAGQRPKEGPPKDATIIALGNNGIILTGDKRVPVIGVDECKSLMSVQRSSEGISINASIYTQSGKLTAQIQNNVLTAINPSILKISQEGTLKQLLRATKLVNDCGFAFSIHTPSKYGASSYVPAGMAR